MTEINVRIKRNEGKLKNEKQESMYKKGKKVEKKKFEKRKKLSTCYGHGSHLY